MLGVRFVSVSRTVTVPLPACATRSESTIWLLAAVPYSKWYVAPASTVAVITADSVRTDSAGPVVAVACANAAVSRRAASFMAAFEHAARQDDAPCPPR